ncbi:WD repeat-containing protein on Y chromosome-like [Actinia tenebrosa]|uniref:WD repeat-containing protein on Y chromosome-like n=1 Tax=Actinia tenebrosa TaxID=6105 RepID=A0A6P8HLQ9_ACTTE|nr:WD repeat-containing protein on Y chromosome-like [Actinia tenebrosa]
MMPSFLTVPGTNGDGQRGSISLGSSRGLSACSKTSQTSGSTLQLRTVVRMLAPVIWSNLEAKRKRENPNYKGQSLASPSTMTVATDDSNGKLVEPIRLEEQLDIHSLEELMYRFKTHMSDKAALRKWNARRGAPLSTHVSGLMTMEEFRSTLSDLVNVESWDTDRAAVFENEMETLFTKVDIASDGLVDWDEFCTYMMIQFKEHDVTTKYGKGSFNPKMNIARIAHNKETTIRTLKDFNPMRYVTVSKEGIIGVWSTELELQRIIEMEGRSPQDKASNKRHIKMWVTDAVTMNNVHKLVVATTNMDLHFYDMSTPIYTPQYHLCALGNVPLCMNYFYDKKTPSGRCMLFFGTDNGSIHALIFSTPLKSLFETPFKKTSGSHRIFFQDISLHARFVTHLTLGTIHSDWVRRVQYVPAKEFIISCSGSARDSLVVRDVDDKKRKTYVFKVAKGIDCFDYNHTLNVIVTGGVDHAVRVWNPYVTVKPIAIMKGHQSSIVDLIIHETLEQVFSYDKEGILKCWEIKEQTCIQSLAIRDPFGHRVPEHGPFPFCLIGSPINSLLITSNDSLIEVKLLGLGTTKAIKTSHAKPLCAAVYNEKINQVITGCEGSVICFWDISTGRKVLQILEAHGNEEISCMHLDKEGSRLMTGARDGSINVWNANNGHLMNKLAALEEAEVTGITSFHAKSKILTVGWHRKIITYHDDKETFVIRPNACWKGGQVHQDDILASAYCPPNFLATSSFDGDIILWCLDREKMIRILKKGSRSLFKSKMKKVGLIGRERKHSRAQVQAKSSAFSAVDRLMFLTARAQSKAQESATLISSENGNLEFWCLYGTAKPMGTFCAAIGENGSILALATDSSNNILLTGDSNGYISIWDISNYCISRAESIIAQVWSTTQRMSSMDDIAEAPPPRMISWQAHSGAVVSLEVVSRDGRTFVISASSDCTARLWTLKGDFVGMFGQKKMWDTDDESTYKYVGTWNEESMADSERSTVCGSISPERGGRDDVSAPAMVTPDDSDRMDTSPNRPESSPSEPQNSFLPQISPDNQPTDQNKDDSLLKKTSEFQRSMTSYVLDRRKPETWSILGHKYNDEFRQRMQTRQSRRNFMGYVDQRLTSCAGLANKCSPFQALQIPATQEYKLPNDLPVTKRMLHKAAKANADPFLGGVNQNSLPVLPAIKGSETFLALNMLPKDQPSQMQGSENASQFSYHVE